MLLALLCLIGLLSAVAETTKISQKQLTTGEKIFVETSTGRQVLFHGVNAIVKGWPYVPFTEYFDADTSLVAKDYEALKSMGMNAIRLGTMWKGAEPIKGQYNQTYFDQLRLIAQAAAKYDIFTILDLHQDVISETVCGEGVPDWMVDLSSLAGTKDAFPAPLADPYTAVASDGPYPTRQDCSKFNWPSYYNTVAAGVAFEQLYDISNDAWALYWKKVAQELGSLPSVLGYELLNEPWAGDTVRNPKLLLPGVADREKLSPIYDKLAKSIREVDDTSMVFFAAVTWDDIVPAGFQHAPDNNSVFAFHYYEPPQAVMETYFHRRRDDARRLNTGMFLTEFERMQDNSDPADPFLRTAQVADQFLASWTMWEYKTFCLEDDASSSSDSQQAAFGSCKTGYGGHELWTVSDGQEPQLNPVAGKKLARTYAQRIAGIVQTMRFDADTADFELVYQANGAAALGSFAAAEAALTEIFLHEAWNYPTGFDVQVFPKDKAVAKKIGENKVGVMHTPLAKAGDMIRVRITRKEA